MPSEALRTASDASFGSLLLAWFERHGRSGLPWRTDRTPYRIVVSEFMLQQTQVERVVPIFERFVARWPAFAALAQASQADVVRAWKGLGYNARAVRLHRLAKEVWARFEGVLPREEAALRELPGIGPYTARAIAAFAFDADAVAFDTNVQRIVQRTQLGLEWPIRAPARALEARAAALLPPGYGYAFNSALMDLGASLCTARTPKCLICPLRNVCAAAPVDAAELARLAAPGPRGSARGERFETTTRYLRGRVVDRLRDLPAGRRVSLLEFQTGLAPEVPHHDAGAVEAALDALAADGLVERGEGWVRLAR
jgi:A/G-specific adenine glycosylase